MAIIQDDFRGFPHSTTATSFKQATATSFDINIHTSWSFCNSRRLTMPEKRSQVTKYNQRNSRRYTQHN